MTINVKDSVSAVDVPVRTVTYEGEQVPVRAAQHGESQFLVNGDGSGPTITTGWIDCRGYRALSITLAWAADVGTSGTGKLQMTNDPAKSANSIDDVPTSSFVIGATAGRVTINMSPLPAYVRAELTVTGGTANQFQGWETRQP